MGFCEIPAFFREILRFPAVFCETQQHNQRKSVKKKNCEFGPFSVLALVCPFYFPPRKSRKTKKDRVLHSY